MHQREECRRTFLCALDDCDLRDVRMTWAGIKIPSQCTQKVMVVFGNRATKIGQWSEKRCEKLSLVCTHNAVAWLDDVMASDVL